MNALVFKGGGVRADAYSGALQVFEQNHLLSGINRVAGSSAGAITAALLACKYDAAGIKEIVGNLNFASLTDAWDPIRVATHYGLYAGDRALQWIETQISAQLGPKATFMDLRNKGGLDLRVPAASIKKQAIQIFSADTTPSAIISEAVRASMSIPLFFKAAQVTGFDDLYVDAGTIWNYPLTIFDKAIPDPEVLGFYLTDFTPQPLPKIGFGEIGQYIKSLFSMLLSAQDIDIGEDPQMETRTLRIDALGISATDFSISSTDKDRLFQSGVDAANQFIISKTL